MRFFLVVFIVCICSFLGCHPFVQATDSVSYYTLRGLFSYQYEELGRGEEPVLPFSKHGQPMTVALLLSSEIERWRCCQVTDKEKQQIVNMIKWLVLQSDMDGDGKVGWGLPQPYDAFQNGTVNPAHHPYTITTALVLLSLVDAQEFLSHLSEESKHFCGIIRYLIREAILRWDNEMWSPVCEEASMGYYWYSPEPLDRRPTFNVSSMWCGAVAKAMYFNRDLFTDDEAMRILHHTDSTIAYLIDRVQLKGPMPFWSYCDGVSRTEDLLHHLYTVYGVEMYREYQSNVIIPWTLSHALDSCESFLVDGKVLELPQWYGNLTEARLWGVGFLIGICGQYNRPILANRTFHLLLNNYGDLDHLRLNPAYGEKFFPRYVAHVLWGISRVLKFEDN